MVSVLLHEVGHAIAARAGGYRVTSFGIGSGKPLLLLRMPRSGTLFYVCRFGLHLSGVTWVFFPGGVPSRAGNLLLACGGALTNAAIASAAAWAFASFEVRSVPFLTVWVPTIVVLLVNSVLALSFFVPRRTITAQQGALASDGFQALATVFPDRFRGKQAGSIAAPLRTLLQKRAFWESIGDTTMLCVALIRAAEAYGELGDRDAARACWEELSTLEVMPGVVTYQQAWSHLLEGRFGNSAAPAATLHQSEEMFAAIGNRSGILMVAWERLIRAGQASAKDRDVSLAALQAEATAYGDARLALSLLADRIDLQATLLEREDPIGSDSRRELAVLERLLSQYDAGRLELESSVFDVRVYERIASARFANDDDGGAAVAYERALSAARRIYVALAFTPEAQKRFVARQATLVSKAMECCRCLGRDADAARYSRLLT